MKAVGIKALKNNLSRFLQEVQAGENIWVTDRDQIVAEIRKPTFPIAGRIDRWEAFLNESEQRGQLRRATRPQTQLDSFPPLPSGIDGKQIQDDSRDDRR